MFREGGASRGWKWSVRSRGMLIASAGHHQASAGPPSSSLFCSRSHSSLFFLRAGWAAQFRLQELFDLLHIARTRSLFVRVFFLPHTRLPVDRRRTRSRLRSLTPFSPLSYRTPPLATAMDDSQTAFASQYPPYAGFEIDMMKVSASSPRPHPALPSSRG